jgi:hypothetical protein
VAVKFADAKPAVTGTVAGTWTAELLLERATVTPPVGAGPLSVMVPADVPGPVRVAGLNVNELTTTGAGLTIRVTATLCGEFEAPAAETVIVALYVPRFSPEGLTETVTVAGAVPDVWPSESHDWDVVAVHVAAPVPALEMVMDSGVGLPLPCTAV